ncbi:hypothetical protein PsorP6_010398 [Peronosclerospora sorghi]|uniref:Uncharacterized protein n=1 Tax=Peronosclerospora sorghi TaxID=230839 RepID=A0ACC0VTI7_9STRA|nr:hypothetical protein PsorP6_010398 [Peronosclerospora sorghi]
MGFGRQNEFSIEIDLDMSKKGFPVKLDTIAGIDCHCMCNSESRILYVETVEFNSLCISSKVEVIVEAMCQATITLMGFFTLSRTEAEKAQRQAIKELEREAKAQRKCAAKERKAQQARVKQEQKEAKCLEKHLQRQAKQQQKEAKKRYREAAKAARKTTKTRRRMARKAEKEHARALRQQATGADTVVAPPFKKSAGCVVCGKRFGQALHRRRHHCRQCRESCCLQCMSRTRYVVPLYALHKPQKVCVVCETLVFNGAEARREPADALNALAGMTHTSTSRRPHSAPLPSTTGVPITLPSTQRARSRSSKSRSGSLWMLPIRPLLRKKSSAERLRNRTMDLDLQIDKRALMSGRVIHVQPQTIASTAS